MEINTRAIRGETGKGRMVLGPSRQARHLQTYRGHRENPTAPPPDSLYRRSPTNCSAGRMGIMAEEKIVKYPAVIDGERGAYGVVIPDLRGAYAMGATVDEALADAEDMLPEFLDVLREQGAPIPPTQRRGGCGVTTRGNARLCNTSSANPGEVRGWLVHSQPCGGPNADHAPTPPHAIRLAGSLGTCCGGFLRKKVCPRL